MATLALQVRASSGENLNYVTLAPQARPSGGILIYFLSPNSDILVRPLSPGEEWTPVPAVGIISSKQDPDPRQHLLQTHDQQHQLLEAPSSSSSLATAAVQDQTYHNLLNKLQRLEVRPQHYHPSHNEQINVENEYYSTRRQPGTSCSVNTNINIVKH